MLSRQHIDDTEAALIQHRVVLHWFGGRLGLIDHDQRRRLLDRMKQNQRRAFWHR